MTIRVLTVVMFVIGTGLSFAAEAERPWTVFAELGLTPTASDPLPGDSALGLGLRRSLSRGVALDFTLGHGLPASMLTKRGEASLKTGTHGRILLQASRRLGARLRGWLGAGPSLLSGDVFGTAVLGRGELGLCLRLGSRWSLFYAAGYEHVLKESRTPFAASDCLPTHDVCPPFFETGRGQVGSRFGLGLGF